MPVGWLNYCVLCNLSRTGGVICTPWEKEIGGRVSWFVVPLIIHNDLVKPLTVLPIFEIHIIFQNNLANTFS